MSEPLWRAVEIAHKLTGRQPMCYLVNVASHRDGSRLQDLLALCFCMHRLRKVKYRAVVTLVLSNGKLDATLVQAKQRGSKE